MYGRRELYGLRELDKLSREESVMANSFLLSAIHQFKERTNCLLEVRNTSEAVISKLEEEKVVLEVEWSENNDGSHVMMIDLEKYKAKLQRFEEVLDGLENNCNLTLRKEFESVMALDELNCCILCQQPLTPFGLHTLCSIPCGHVFGKSCLVTKVAADSKCPRCDKVATSSEIWDHRMDKTAKRIYF